MFLHAGAVLHGHPHRAAEHQPRLRQGPLRPARRLQDPPEEPAVLEAARRQHGVVVDHPRADHLPSAEVQERHAPLRDVCPGPAGNSGVLQLLHLGREQARGRHRRPALPGRPAQQRRRVQPEGPAGRGRRLDEVPLHGSDGRRHGQGAPGRGALLQTSRHRGLRRRARQGGEAHQPGRGGAQQRRERRGWPS